MAGELDAVIHCPYDDRCAPLRLFSPCVGDCISADVILRGLPSPYSLICRSRVCCLTMPAHALHRMPSMIPMIQRSSQRTGARKYRKCDFSGWGGGGVCTDVFPVALSSSSWHNRNVRLRVFCVVCKHAIPSVGMSTKSGLHDAGASCAAAIQNVAFATGSTDGFEASKKRFGAGIRGVFERTFASDGRRRQLCFFV